MQKTTEQLLFTLKENGRKISELELMILVVCPEANKLHVIEALFYLLGVRIIVAKEEREILQILHQHHKETTAILIDLEKLCTPGNLFEKIHKIRHDVALIVFNTLDEFFVGSLPESCESFSCLHETIIFSPMSDV